MNTVKDILNSQQFQGLLKSNETEKPEPSVDIKRKPQYKLYAIFKVAAPHASWNWDPLWLMDYYAKKEGLLFTGQWEAEYSRKCRPVILV